jgi:hypothetical protein
MCTNKQQPFVRKMSGMVRIQIRQGSLVIYLFLNVSGLFLLFQFLPMQRAANGIAVSFSLIGSWRGRQFKSELAMSG